MLNILKDKLSSLESLDNELVIIVPDHRDKKLRERCLNNTIDEMNKYLGGSTVTQGLGSWNNGENVIREHVTIVSSNCNDSSLSNWEFIFYCKQLKKTLSQDCIAFKLNNKMYFV